MQTRRHGAATIYDRPFTRLQEIKSQEATYYVMTLLYEI